MWGKKDKWKIIDDDDENLSTIHKVSSIRRFILANDGGGSHFLFEVKGSPGFSWIFL